MKLGITILLLSSQAAFASLEPNASTAGGCKESTFKSNLKHNAQLVSLMPTTDAQGNIIRDKDGIYKDTRMNLMDNHEKLSGDLALSRREAQELTDATGTIECKGERPPADNEKHLVNGSTNMIHVKREGTGFLYGNGEQIATAAHTLFDAKGNLMKECFLLAPSGSELKQRIPLNLSMIEVIKDPNNVKGAEIAVVKLVSKQHKRDGTPLEGLKLNSTGKPVEFDRSVGMISAIQYKSDRTKPGVRTEKIGGPGKQLIVQESKRGFHEEIANDPAHFGEGTGTSGSSGGYGYSRVNQKIEVNTIIVKASKPEYDGQPFDYKKGVFVYGVVLDRETVSRMMDFQERTRLPK